MRKLLFVAALALSLAACDHTGPIVGNGVAPTPSGSASPVCAATADAMFAAEAAYNVPAHAYVTADAKGLLSVAVKAKVKPLLVTAYQALTKARLFYQAGNSVAFCNAKADVETSAKDASGLIPK